MVQLKTLVLLGVLGALLVTSVPVSALESGAVARPNIIVIMTDDQDAASLSKLPNIQALLADEGTTFVNNIVTYSKCCPSRASFLTGQYPHNNGVEANSLPLGSYARLDHTNTLPVWLQDEGYYTAHIGKYLNGYGQLDSNPGDSIPASLEIPPGYSEWYGSVDPTTYSYYGYTLNENGVLVQYGDADGDYQTDVLAGKAEDFLRRRASVTDGTPFFLIIAPLAPHHDTTPPVSPEPAPRYKGYFSTEVLPTPPNFNEADMSDKPGFLKLLPPMGEKRIADITACYRTRLETLLAVDDMVESVVGTLSTTGQLDNTIIIYTSDNGWFQGEHRIPYGKEFAYEPSIRVPLILRGPGIPRGKQLTNLVANIDLAPTIVEMTGVTPGRVMDGIPLMQLLKRETTRNGILIEAKGVGPSGDAEGGLRPENDVVSLNFNAVRTRDYVYVSYNDVSLLRDSRIFSLIGGEELYDLNKDPYELQNVARDPEYRAVRAGLKSRLEALISCSGSTCW